MTHLSELFDNNREWSARMTAERPDFFSKLAAQQSPKYLWIGCADSRVPANEIVGLLPGEMFVHRNVANLMVHTDLNCLSVLQYAVEVLQVEHIIVTGHYGCGGIQAALSGGRLGLIDNWLRHVQDVAEQYASQLTGIEDPKERADRLCELNVMAQVVNVCRTTIVQDAWERGRNLTVHGWIYNINDGLLHDLSIHAKNLEELSQMGTNGRN